MKKIIPYIIILALGLALVWIWFKSNTQPTKPIIITHTKYKDSPLIAYYKSKSDSLEKSLKPKKEIFYKYITIYKDTLKVKHDTIFNVLFLGNEIIQKQDSMLASKDSVIKNLTAELIASKDTAKYYYVLYIDQKTKTKRWRRVSIVSLIANGLSILK